jgi:hypothetical protein
MKNWGNTIDAEKFERIARCVEKARAWVKRAPKSAIALSVLDSAEFHMTEFKKEKGLQ